MMKRIEFCLTWVLLLLLQTAFAQTFTPLAIEVEAETGVLSNPWGGGLNCPQLSEADLNNDGLLDLYVFDRAVHLHLAYVRKNNQYVFAPELVANFPALTEWSMLRDYNGDGISDIIAYSDIPGIDGLTAYTGYWQGNKLAFKRFPFKGPFNLAYFPLNSGGKAQVYISRIDIPAFDDVDCDSDLDVITFNLSGGYIEWYQNLSVEKGYGRDSMIFKLQSNCWGGVYEDGLSANMSLSSAPGKCF
ncbi:MAG TPA: VCBS repeat-containing protein, partial [Haliscomenobacter sp.]|nr:VCBS repeat-containing protein [Haliscomenobacter sp.]